HGYSGQFVRIKHFQTVFICSAAFTRVRRKTANKCLPDFSGNKIANAPAAILRLHGFRPRFVQLIAGCFCPCAVQIFLFRYHSGILP
ncbi:hypothetical protein, partial [Ochrobactrum sp. SFR4]|uniref:hypothetical protein n=1 Tax=Ochrobactrum sp. SFR4 TaxID=2717368 RepID=UPI001C8B6C15